MFTFTLSRISSLRSRLSSKQPTINSSAVLRKMRAYVCLRKWRLYKDLLSAVSAKERYKVCLIKL